LIDEEILRMKTTTILFGLLIIFLACQQVLSYCPLDHLFIGCNEDSIGGTADDMKLFIDCRHKYRDAENPDERFYTLSISGLDPCSFILQEPGFDEINDGSQYDHPVKDPNRCLEGTRNEDYQIIVECVSISDNFKVTNLSGSIELVEPRDYFIHSEQPDTHIHLWYVWKGCEPYVEPNELQWVTYYLRDSKGKYNPSETFSVAFVQEPLAGDLELNGSVEANDLVQMSYYWLAENATEKNDYYERADCDYSGSVNIADFAMLANNWLKTTN
jgi:hypothetical protein